VGTQQEGSGLRLGQEWRGVDTPSLFGLFDSAPYFHDGSGATLMDVWRRNEDDRHGHTSTLDDESVQALNQFLMELEGL
jgi:large repetitive protein